MIFHDDGQVRLYQGDARAVLRELPEESVQCVVTSPPYWSLRDYGVEPNVWGGDPEHEHEWNKQSCATSLQGTDRWQHADNFQGITRQPLPRIEQVSQGQFCECSAWRGALGLEPTPELYVAHMVEVFRAVRRVMRKDATLWLNIGDSYAGYHGNSKVPDSDAPSNKSGYWENMRSSSIQNGLKPKDLVGIPWMLAFALRADGWWLRQDIIWAKPNPMPESVTDRCTKAHEYLFLLTKSARYYYDADTIREAHAEPWRGHGEHESDSPHSERPDGDASGLGRQPVFVPSVRQYNPAGRNKRSVWTIPTAPFPLAHFATFPPALVEPCVLAGSREGDTVLDPFVGSGTTCMVAKRHGRNTIGIDLKEEYLKMAVRRVGPQISLLLNQTR